MARPPQPSDAHTAPARRRAAWCGASVLALAVALTGVAHAAPARVAVDDTTPTLTQAADSTWSGTLSVTNLTDGAVTLAVTTTRPADRSCAPALSAAAIGAAQSREVRLSLAPRCPATAELLLALVVAGDARRPIPVTAELKARPPSPDWEQLWAFVAGPAIALILLLVFAAASSTGPHLRAPLQHLPATYSFKESWVSNLTVIAGVLTGFFGSSDVLTSLFGADDDAAIALATVGSAIALILIGSGPIILTAFRTTLTVDGQRVPAFTGLGLLLATAAAVGGAAGQLWIGWKTGEQLNLDGWEDRVAIVFVVAIGLLAVYTFRTFVDTLQAGTTPPPPAKPSDLARLVDLLKQALERRSEVPDDAIGAVLDEVTRPSVLARPVHVLRDALAHNEVVPDAAIPTILEELAGVATTVASTAPTSAEAIGAQRRTAAMP